MSKNASMPTSRFAGFRNLFTILFVEIMFIVGLHALGSMPHMQIDFSNFSRWLDLTPPEVALTASIRVLALAIAYWVLITSAVYIIARAFKIPGILRAMEFATLPFVRKAIDGALAATIIGGTVFGGAGAVFAKSDNASKVAAPTAVTATYKDLTKLYNPTPADDGPQVTLDTPTKTPSTSDNFAGEQSVTLSSPAQTQAAPVDNGTPQKSPSGNYVPVPADDTSNTETETPVSRITPSPAETEVTTTTLPKVVVPSTTRTPQPAESDPTTTTTTPKVTVPTTRPTPQPSTPTTVPSVTVEGERVQRPNDTAVTPAAAATSYTVVDGDNFWNIAKAQVEKSVGRTPTNAEVANYWVKLIDANKGNIRSGDASLIYAGEVFNLPTV